MRNQRCTWTNLLHIHKNLRAILIVHHIHISDVLPVINFIQIIQDLKVEEEIYQNGKVIFMRNDLALRIFHSDNLKSLFDAGIWNE